MSYTNPDVTWWPTLLIVGILVVLAIIAAVTR